MTILRTYVENQAILGLILLDSASKCKQTKEPGSEDCFWTHIFIFLWDYCQVFFFFLSRCKRKRIKLWYDRFQLVKKNQKNPATITQVSTASNTKWTAKKRTSYVFFIFYFYIIFLYFFIFFYIFYILLQAQKLEDWHPNTIKLTSRLVHVLCDFTTTSH